MGKFVYILFALALIASAHAAPKEEDAKETEVAAPAKTTATERDVLVADGSWTTWLSSSSWNLVTAGAGIVAVLAGVGLGFYYYYYVTVVHTDVQYQGQPNTYPYSQYNSYATGRALDTTPGSRWNFAKVLEYIDIAQKTYEGFDWQNLECQKRVLCELSQKDNWAGETGRKITNNYLLTFMDALDGIPIPRMIQAFLIEYKEAISQGKNSQKQCGEVYSKCKFSIKEVFADAAKKKTL